MKAVFKIFYMSFVKVFILTGKSNNFIPEIFFNKMLRKSIKNIFCFSNIGQRFSIVATASK